MAKYPRDTTTTADSGGDVEATRAEPAAPRVPAFAMPERAAYRVLRAFADVRERQVIHLPDGTYAARLIAQGLIERVPVEE